MLPFDQFIGELNQADVALDLMAWNLERELAITIRSTTYLWAGLPIVYNDFADLAVLIKDYDAGWCVDPADAHALRDVVDEIYRDPDRTLQKSHNATRLARERFAWDRAVEPLLQLVDSVSALPSRHVDIIVDFPENADLAVVRDHAVRQFFLCRSAGLSRVEVRVATHERTSLAPVSFKISRVASEDWTGRAITPSTNRRTLAELDLPGERLFNNEWISLSFPRDDQSRGGIYCLELTSSAPNEQESISPWAVRSSPFPLIGLYHGAHKIDRAALCLRTTCVDPPRTQLANAQ